MSLITLISDLGENSHYVAQAKGRICDLGAYNFSFVDLTHSVPPNDLEETYYFMSLCYAYFPKGTIHLIGTQAQNGIERYALYVCEGHYFISEDNGIVPLLLEGSTYEVYEFAKKATGDFALRDIFPVGIAAVLSGGSEWSKLPVIEKPHKMLLTQPWGNEDILKIKVVYVDSRGNAFTNLTYEKFKEFAGDKTPLLEISKEIKSDNYVEDWTESTYGDICIMFPDRKYMMIGFNGGDARGLLGLKKGSHVMLTL